MIIREATHVPYLLHTHAVTACPDPPFNPNLGKNHARALDTKRSLSLTSRGIAALAGPYLYEALRFKLMRLVDTAYIDMFTSRCGSKIRQYTKRIDIWGDPSYMLSSNQALYVDKVREAIQILDERFRQWRDAGVLAPGAAGPSAATPISTRRGTPSSA